MKVDFGNGKAVKVAAASDRVTLLVVAGETSIEIDMPRAAAASVAGVLAQKAGVHIEGSLTGDRPTVTTSDGYTVESLLAAGDDQELPSPQTFWYSDNEEGPYEGPFDNQEAALAHANAHLEPGSAVHVGTMTRFNLLRDLSGHTYLNGITSEDELIGPYIEELSWLEESPIDFWRLKSEQVDDLTLRLRRAMAEWMVAHDVKQLGTIFPDYQGTVPDGEQTGVEGGQG